MPARSVKPMSFDGLLCILRWMSGYFKTMVNSFIGSPADFERAGTNIDGIVVLHLGNPKVACGVFAQCYGVLALY